MEQCSILVVIPVMVLCAGPRQKSQVVGIHTVSFFAGAIISIHNLIAVRIIVG
jgi:hypothetical protein